MRIRSSRFTVIGGELYKRSYSGILLRCLNSTEATYVMRVIHEGNCGNNSGGRALAQKILRQRYFWPSLAKDALKFSKRCKNCQFSSNIPHVPPKRFGQRKFAAVVVEHITKGVEVEAVAKINENEVMKFL
ncbi:hypothetical protein Salat_1165000 [Sesamum alatum]|uniref:Integrase zinc-binding domain-containing protein n=1 Tax=Sesamum alatum TaxID=300844 RepID=A0AAE1YEN4_9LAMI|nr:hypothetical protein Salat_1165000 [Sesamum alatum]